MKMGFLGPAGTFTEQAAMQIAKSRKNVQLVAFSTIQNVIEAVASEEIEEGAVPFENSIEGTVTAAIDALIFETPLFIKEELVLKVSQNFLVQKDYAGQPITKILSHPQGLAQCDKFLRAYYPRVPCIVTSSTAEAARLVAVGEGGTASISPRQAAKLYGLQVLHADIQDEKQNATRFVVVTKQRPAMTAGFEKTSIVFETEHKPGQLYKVLDILSIWNLNMTKIESRPMKHTLGTYCFFVDLTSDNTQDLTDALKMVARKTKSFRYLGTYPIYKE